MEEEIWKDVPGFDGAYQASNLGRIKSITRKVTVSLNCGATREMTVNGRIMSPCKHEHGYLLISPRKNGKSVRTTVHAMVALAFLGERPEGMCVNHIDNNPANNRADNLEYCTHRANILHACWVGSMNNNGEGNGKAKAREETVIAAHKMLCEGAASTAVMKRFSLSRAQVHKIRSGIKWKYLGLGPVPLPPRTRIPQETRRKIIAMKSQGKSYREILQETGIHSHSANRILRQAGLAK